MYYSRRTTFIIAVLLLFCFQAFAWNIANDTSRPDSIRDGSSFEKAIIINKTHEGAGDAAEYIWLGAHYSDYNLYGQSLVFYNYRVYDIIHFKTGEGVPKKIYFDITKCYGKW